MNLAAVDLNLLLAFDALMREGSVTRAGHRLGLSQPAMSGALNRLRHLVGDELFIRRGSVMEPTARALELVAPLRSALEQIEAALTPSHFDPAHMRRTFRIACHDLGAAIFLPELAERLSHLAPGISVDVITVDEERAISLLESGAIELAIGQSQDRDGKFQSAMLYTAPCVCAMRGSHPLAGRNVTQQHLADSPQLVVREWAPVIDAALARHGIDRRAALTVPNYLVAPFILARTDLIALLPLRLVQRFRPMVELFTAAPPFRSVASFFGIGVWNGIPPTCGCGT